MAVKVDLQNQNVRADKTKTQHAVSHAILKLRKIMQKEKKFAHFKSKTRFLSNPEKRRAGDKEIVQKYLQEHRKRSSTIASSKVLMSNSIRKRNKVLRNYKKI